MSNEIFNEWKFIKSIPIGAKPCFYDKSFVYINEWFPTLKRRYKGEKAEKGVLHVTNLIQKTKQYYKGHVEFLNILKKHLIDSLKGLDNLIDTYSKDEQEEISKNYIELSKEIENMIIEIETIIKNRTNFFNYLPEMRR